MTAPVPTGAVVAAAAAVPFVNRDALLRALAAAAPAIRAEAAAAERERIRQGVAEIRSRMQLGGPPILTRAGTFALLDEFADLLQPQPEEGTPR